MRYEAAQGGGDGRSPRRAVMTFQEPGRIIADPLLAAERAR
jgi:hypothetical protein